MLPKQHIIGIDSDSLCFQFHQRTSALDTSKSRASDFSPKRGLTLYGNKAAHVKSRSSTSHPLRSCLLFRATERRGLEAHYSRAPFLGLPQSVENKSAPRQRAMLPQHFIVRRILLDLSEHAWFPSTLSRTGEDVCASLDPGRLAPPSV